MMEISLPKIFGKIHANTHVESSWNLYNQNCSIVEHVNICTVLSRKGGCHLENFISDNDDSDQIPGYTGPIGDHVSHDTHGQCRLGLLVDGRVWVIWRWGK